MSQERLSLRKIREILRLKEEAGLSNRAISRACKISNSTVGEYLRRAKAANLSWPLPDGMSEEELYQQLFPEELLPVDSDRPEPNYEYIKKELKKKGVTLKLLWEEYKAEHPERGYQYTQFCEHYRQWANTQSPTGRFTHKGGETLEVDYAGMTLTITDPETGKKWSAPVFVTSLPASGYIYAEVQASQEKANFIGGHIRAFSFIGGVPIILRPDNPKMGVTHPNYYEPDLNPTYQEMAEYYQVAVLPARVRKPRDKGAVENGVQNVERWVLAPLRNTTFFSLAEANRAVQKLVEALNNKTMPHIGKSRRQLFEEIDSPELRPLPATPYELAIWKTAKVNIDYHVAFEKHFYSVPFPLIRKQVEIKATEHLVEVFHKGKQVAVHPRSSAQGRFTTRAEHMPPNHRFVLELDADWLLKQAAEVGPHTHAYVQTLLKSRLYPQQSYRSCLGVLGLARKYPQPLFENVCERALQARLFSYKQLKAELEHAPQSVQPLVHENIRGEAYFNN